MNKTRIGWIAGAFGGLALVAAVSGCAAASEQDVARDEATGEIVESDDLGVFAMRVGDCVQLPGEDSEVETLEGVPCDTEHDGEVYATPEVDLTEWPGDEAMTQLAADLCVEAFDAYTGLDFYTDEDWDIFNLSPTEGSFAVDDREVVCLATPLDGSSTTERLPEA